MSASRPGRCRRTRDRCIQVRPFLKQINEDLVRLFAITNLLMKNPPFLLRVTQALIRTKYPKEFEKLLECETAEVKAGMAAIAEASGQRIREAEASAANPSFQKTQRDEAPQRR